MSFTKNWDIVYLYSSHFNVMLQFYSWWSLSLQNFKVIDKLSYHQIKSSPFCFSDIDLTEKSKKKHKPVTFNCDWGKMKDTWNLVLWKDSSALHWYVLAIRTLLLQMVQSTLLFVFQWYYIVTKTLIFFNLMLNYLMLKRQLDNMLLFHIIKFDI